jgi:hypothetical protein
VDITTTLLDSVVKAEGYRREAPIAFRPSPVISGGIVFFQISKFPNSFRLHKTRQISIDTGSSLITIWTGPERAAHNQALSENGGSKRSKSSERSDMVIDD